jgi:hypothetical protein
MAAAITIITTDIPERSMSIRHRFASFLFAGLLAMSLDAGAWDRGDVERFATLPANALNPEGIAIDPRNGDVYATGFDPTNSHPAEIYVFDSRGNFKDRLHVSGSSSALLGLDFHPDTHALLVIDFGAGNVLDVDPHTGASSVFMPATSGDGLNALTFDHAGNVYVSASFSGRIYRTGPGGGAPTIWAEDPPPSVPPAPPVPQNLKPNGFPPFGANGLQFNHDESALFVANTANDTIVRVANNGGVGRDPGGVHQQHQRRRRADHRPARQPLGVRQSKRRDRGGGPDRQGHRQARRLRRREARLARGPALPGEPRAARRLDLHHQPFARPSPRGGAAVGRQPVGGAGDAPHSVAHPRADSLTKYSMHLRWPELRPSRA